MLQTILPFRLISTTNSFRFQPNGGTDTLVLLSSIMLCFGTLLLSMICCEMGEQLSDTCGGVEESLAQVRWYLFPLEIQQLFPIVIQYSQERLVIRFFGSMAVTRAQFRKVSLERVIAAKCKVQVRI